MAHRHKTPVDGCFGCKAAGIGVVNRSNLTKPVVTEGRQHPESGKPWKRTVTEAGAVTEHNTKDDRQDVVVRPETVHAVISKQTKKLENP